MKTNWRPHVAVCFLVVALVWMSSAMKADVGASARTVRVGATVDAHAVRIEAKASGPFEYTTYRPSETLFVVDLAGVRSSGGSGVRVLKSQVVSSYRVLQYRAGDRAIVRLEVLLRAPVQPRVHRENSNELTVVFEGGAAPTTAIQPEANKPAPSTPLRASEAGTPVTRPATLIEKIEVNRVAAETQVRVEGNGRLSYQTMRLRQPDRVVLDFSGTRPRVAAKNISVSTEPVARVRVGQFKPGITRVVVELAKAAPYTVDVQGSSLTLSFLPLSFIASAPAGAPTSGTGTGELVEVVAPLDSARGALSESRKAREETPVQEGKEPGGGSSRQALAGDESSEAVAPNQPQPTQPISSAPSVTSNAPATAVPPLDSARDAGTRAPGSGDSPAVVPQGAAKYSGEPISLNLKDVDLKDFFRLIHEISGLNVVVDPNVKGTLTIVLDDVPWDQALDIVLKNNNLDKQLEGNVLRIATRDTLKKEAETVRDLAKAQAEAVDVETRTRVLSYAKATAVRDTLKRFLSSRGEIIADERLNTLIIRDIPSVFPDVDNLIRQLDKKSQQVEIEARVVSASRDFSREVGTQFGFATTTTSKRSVFGGLVGNSSFVSPVVSGLGLPAPPLVATGTTSIPLNAALGATAPNSGATFAHRSPNFALDFILSAAESKGVAKLLSKPKVITQNNVKATVKQGTRIPIQTVVNNTISVQYIDASLVLEVTPQITAEGTVFMEVKVTNDSPDFSRTVGGNPAIITQSAETRVLITDGGTVVIGGVIITKQNTTIAQVPLFGSVPLIGNLFKRTSVTTSSLELLFFLTPRIVPG